MEIPPSDLNVTPIEPTPEETTTPPASLAPALSESITPDNEKIIACVAYLPLLCIGAAILVKDRPKIHFHAQQGSVLFFAWVALYIVARVFMAISPNLGYLLIALGNLAFLGFMIVGMLNAWRGKESPLPFFGQFVSKLPF